MQKNHKNYNTPICILLCLFSISIVPAVYWDRLNPRARVILQMRNWGSASGLTCSRWQLGGERDGTWSWTLRSHLQPSFYPLCWLYQKWVFGVTLMSHPGMCLILILGPMSRASPPQDLFICHPWLCSSRPTGNTGWDFSVHTFSLSQVTLWPITMADPSPPMTRTRTQPSPTVPSPTRGLSGTRTVTVSTWWGDMGTITTVRWVDGEGPGQG